jgi:hypothetical protein
MKIGIVGSEQAKFTKKTERFARESIRYMLNKKDIVISGECHLGGVDSYAREVAEELGLKFIGYAPKNRSWASGYKPRNIKIAEASDLVICITLRKLPKKYKGMKFDLCYHCGTKDHVKSGGCWTMKYAKELGKETRLIVI